MVVERAFGKSPWRDNPKKVCPNIRSPSPKSPSPPPAPWNGPNGRSSTFHANYREKDTRKRSAIPRSLLTTIAIERWRSSRLRSEITTVSSGRSSVGPRLAGFQPRGRAVGPGPPKRFGASVRSPPLDRKAARGRHRGGEGEGKNSRLTRASKAGLPSFSLSKLIGRKLSGRSDECGETKREGGRRGKEAQRVDLRRGREGPVEVGDRDSAMVPWTRGTRKARGERPEEDVDRTERDGRGRWVPVALPEARGEKEN